MKKRFAVVGGSCVDIFATSASPLIKHDSNPGKVNIGFGGVGRNIVENLARLGQEAILIAAFGSDPFSARMISYTSNAGVRTDHSLISEEEKAPYYISVNDADGDMAVAVNDMEICGLITPAFLSRKLSVLNRCDAVILDTNIPKESIDFLASRCTAPLFAEAVSTHKVVKLAAALPHLDVIKANLQEAEALLNMRATADLSSLRDAAGRFHDAGIACVLITLGASGAFFSRDGGEQTLMTAFPVNAVNANGCGDAFGAVAFLGILLAWQPEELLRNALAAAAITAQSALAVSPQMSIAAINAFLEERK